MGSACGLTTKTDCQGMLTIPVLQPIWSHSVAMPETPKSTSCPSVKKLIEWNTLHPQLSHGFPIASLRKHILLGPLPQYRWQAWLHYLNLPPKCSSIAYHNLPLANPSILEEIRKDLHRTYPEEAYFSEGSPGYFALKRVLGKFGGVHQNIGYCQGMNFIVGFLLMVSGGSEVETFYMFEEIFLKYGDLFNFSLGGVRKRIKRFQQAVERQLPELTKHFDALGLDQFIWLPRWLLTLYTRDVLPQITVRIWDYFLCEGSEFLSQLALAILSTHQQELLKMDLAEINEYFNEYFREGSHIEKLLLSAKAKSLHRARVKTLFLLRKKVNPFKRLDTFKGSRTPRVKSSTLQTTEESTMSILTSRPW